MKSLAHAVINLAAFIELSSDDAINSDAAVQALEQLASDLENAESEEIEHLEAVIRQKLFELGEERTPEQEKLAEFYSNFLEDFRLPDEE